ncbi:MAG TPA: PKD domain-containing protein, partial [Flavobacteriales bacterium]|nr:PKD domain-containing protein [Flavobacteriales bacterium]
NDNGTGVFAASISCITPCFPPVAVADMGEVLPALVCQGEVLNFDGSDSYAQPGFSLVQMDWDFGDGTTATGTTVSHSYSEPGAYIVNLTVTDDNGCTNTVFTNLDVYVGTTPSFSGTTESLTVCQGGTVDLNGIATPLLWSALPTADFGAGVYLPDDVGQPFSSQLTYGFFPTGTTLTNVNQIIGICADLEHSFMGDPVITVTCPSGQSVILHQQGGGGTYIGGANDTDSDLNPVPGDCWHYCWSANAQLGTFADCSAFGPTPNVIIGGNPPANALAPGTYTPVTPINNLIGCPLNGTWTFTFTDMWLIDNGNLCAWEIDFDPSLYPDLIQFTPVITDQAWSGSDVVLDPNDPTHASITPQTPGTYTYTYSVTDDFGCTYDTALTVTVTHAPVAGASIVPGSICSDPTLLHAEIVDFIPPPPTCIWTLEMHDTFGDGWNGGANVVIVINGTPVSYTVPAGSNDVTVNLNIPVGASIQVLYTAGTVWNNENSFEIVDNGGATVYDSPSGPPTGTLWQGQGSCGPGVGPLQWHWTPATGVDLPNAQDVTTQITQPTEFVITVNAYQQPWCFTTDTIFVQPPSWLEDDSVVVDVLCNGGNGSITLITTGPGGPWNYAWEDGNGSVIQSTTASNGDALSTVAGTYTAYISEGANGNGCLDTLTATITEPPPLVWVTTPDDTLICLTGNAVLAAEAQGGTGAITLNWQGIAGNGPHTVSPIDTTDYVVQAVAADGCTTLFADATVFVNPPLTVDPLLPDTEC